MSFSIRIVAGHDKKVSHVVATGSEQCIITDEDKGAFRLGDKHLKEAVRAYFGKKPNDAYLHSPTPWGDLYKKQGWEQVKMVMEAKHAEILEVDSEPVILSKKELKNDSSEKATFDASISDSVTNTVSSSWSTGGNLTIGNRISYGVSLDVKPWGVGGGAHAENELSISYSQSWGIGGQTSKETTMGSSSGVSVTLDPGETVLAVLSASRGVMKVRVEYTAHLIGQTAVNYNPKYKGHHFYALPIVRVMRSAGISNSISSSEIIEINYYSDGKVELRDKETNKLKATHSMHDIPGL